MKKEEEVVVLFPSPGMGHLISMVELGKFILSLNQSSSSLSIVILTIDPPFNTGSTSAYISTVSAQVPSIRFHTLPPITLPNDPSSYPNIESITFDLLRLHDPNVRSALQSISLSTGSNISAFIIDLFCSSAFSIGINLNIPTYHFWTSGIGCLSCFFYFPQLHETIPGRLRDWKQIVEIPGLPSCAAIDLPSPMLDRDSYPYNKFLELSLQLHDSSGILVNSFDSLEPDSLKALQGGLCLPDKLPTPPAIYCVGPLIASGREKSSTDVRHECLTWLDTQPTRSVVYLCFGSQGAFSAEQLKEMAVGLEKSGQRFLWVVRSPPSKEANDYFLPRPEPDLDTLLPGGYLERVSGRGMVVKSWAPQVSVLGHESVGAFVTHCGWNSVLEAVLAGVPMVTWPLYAEQRHNKVILVEGLKLALAMMNEEEEEEGGLVMAETVERLVREIMESEEAKSIRDRVRVARGGALAAMGEEGSSLTGLTKFKESLKRRSSS
ncbi:UDP-glycosyltransferase 88A1-like [Impatiens glandulifera]|uniref:UDP-glycosyltransferase 88A1-like n=1 Tax=Impatiens glandulifera TaxID=253017 RepID=UPI001FB12A33|nr:UDP-glycosyltransferase 88A1-like [Impatiens glandulifera]